MLPEQRGEPTKGVDEVPLSLAEVWIRAQNLRSGFPHFPLGPCFLSHPGLQGNMGPKPPR